MLRDISGANNPNYKGYMHLQRACAQCGATIAGPRKTQKYCSCACQVAAQRVTDYAKICAWCGKDFLHRKAKHCSSECADAHRISRHTESGARKRELKKDAAAGIVHACGGPKAPRTLRVCVTCGKGMLLLPSDVTRGTKHCSRECYAKQVSIRQTGAGHHMYKHGLTAQRMSEIQQVRKHKDYAVWRKAVFARDMHTCRSCGSGGSLEAHHHTPWVQEPKLRLKVSNGISLCKECHRLWHLYNKKGLFVGKESTLQTHIIDALRDYGFYVYNVPGNPMGTAGTPDLLVAYKGFGGGIECKVYPNYLSALQVAAGERVRAAGGLFYVAQSVDDIGRIIEMFELRSCTGAWVKPVSESEHEAALEHIKCT